MDMELIAENAEGIIAHDRLPLRGGADPAAAGPVRRGPARSPRAYQDIFGKENYFLELMDHGIDIEREVRAGAAAAGQGARHPAAGHERRPLRHEDQADAHDNLLCIGVGKNKDDPNRFRFNGAGYYLKTADEMRQLFSELPEACDNTLLIAERVESTTTRSSTTSTGCRSSPTCPRGRRRSRGCARSASGPRRCATATPSRPRSWSASRPR